MSGRRYSRRETMKMLAAVPAFSAATRPLQSRAAAPRTRSVRLGGPLPGAGRGAPAPDPVELARAARQLGYRAMLCPQVDLKDTARIRAIEAACKAEDVVIAEVGAFGFNMMARDAGERKAALDMMCEKLALADEVGALCAVNISGFRGPDAKNRPHPENLNAVGFDLTVENVRHILDTVKPKRAKFTVEAMPWIVPDGPDSYLDADQGGESARLCRPLRSGEHHQLAAPPFRKRQVPRGVFREDRPMDRELSRQRHADHGRVDHAHQRRTTGHRHPRLEDLPEGRGGSAAQSSDHDGAPADAGRVPAGAGLHLCPGQGDRRHLLGSRLLRLVATFRASHQTVGINHPLLDSVRDPVP